MQAPLYKFLESAKENVEHYGKHGIDTFIASFHGNVTLNTGLIVCFKTFDEYNKVIDSFQERKNGK